MRSAKSRFPIGLVVLFLLFAAPDHAFGWGNTWLGTNLERIVNATRWRAGSLRYNAAFLVDNAGYDSDIYYASTSDPVPDYTFIAGPNLRFFLPLKEKIVFDISESPQYAFFLHTTKERSWDNTFRGQIHLVSDRFYLQAGEGLSSTRERLSTELNVKIRLRQSDFVGLGLWQLSRGTSVGLQFRRLSFDYGNVNFGGSNIRENLNRNESYITLKTYFQKTANMRLTLDGEYGSYIFTEKISKSKNSRSFSVSGGADFRPAPEVEIETRGIQGRLNLGLKRFDILDRQKKDYTGLVGNTNLAIGLVSLTTVRGFFARDVQFSAFADYTYFLQTVYGAGLAHFLTRRILVGYDFVLGRNTYPAPGNTAGGVVLSDRSDQFRTHAFRVNLRMKRDLELNLVAGLGRRQSNITGLVGNRNFFGFNLIYGYLSAENLILVTPRY